MMKFNSECNFVIHMWCSFSNTYTLKNSKRNQVNGTVPSVASGSSSHSVG